MTPTDRLRLQHGAIHLHRLGARVVAEFLAEAAQHRDDPPALLERLDGYRRALTPEMLRATGGDCFPPRLTLFRTTPDSVR